MNIILKMYYEKDSEKSHVEVYEKIYFPFCLCKYNDEGRKIASIALTLHDNHVLINRIHINDEAYKKRMSTLF